MSEERSLWVIGDIHGMLDPLTVLLNTIRCVEYSRDRHKTIVFLGDYIDHGPCSKEVIDSLLGLRDEFETVFLAGNHEDMLLHFLEPQAGMEKYGKAWLDGNGGQATVCSFMKSRSVLKHLWLRSSTVQGIRPEDFRLHPRYLDFLDGLVYAHREELDLGERVLKLCFTHAPLHRRADVLSALDDDEPDIPIERQLSARTRQEFTELCRRYPMWIERYQLWNRSMPRSKYGAYTLIHGHTPTPIIDRDHAGRLANFDPESALPFVIFPEGSSVEAVSNGDEIWFGAKLSDVVGINIDTGCVYGDALTALNFSTNRIRRDARIGVIQVHPGWAQRDFGGCTRFHFRFAGV